jgi:hypothetical protein
MKAIVAAVWCCSLAMNCFGAGDAASSSTKDGHQHETTTFQRDGKKILVITTRRSTDPKARFPL